MTTMKHFISIIEVQSVLIIFLLGFVSTNCIAQDTLVVDLFATTDNFLKNEVVAEDIMAIVSRHKETSIEVKRFLDPVTGHKSKKYNNSWALYYEGEYYFNLGYSDNLTRRKAFVKIQDKGPKYASVYFDHNSTSSLKPTESSPYYGLGLLGYTLSRASKSKMHWLTDNGHKSYVLLIDLLDIKKQSDGRHAGSIGFFLTYRLVKKLFLPNMKKEEIKKLSIEDIHRIIREHNNSYSPLN